MNYRSKIIGGILLVAGTTIGAGMLALPVSTGQGGFIPSIALLVICWAFMTFTAFLMLEVNLWMEDNTNLVSMAKRTLGKWGAAVSWVIYLFLLYLLTTAYIAGSGPITIDVINALTGYLLPSWAGAIPLLVIFGVCVYKGTSTVDYVNRLLMLALVIAYAAMVIFLTPYVEERLLEHIDWSHLLIATSVVTTSFGFHIIIPSLTSYLNRDLHHLRRALLIGSIIPLIVYIIWELLTLGIIPLEGDNSLAYGYQTGVNAAQLLTTALGHTTLGVTARVFAFCAIVTSFLGVSLSLSDFLADGLKIEKTRPGRILLYVLTFMPPLLFALTNPRAFLSALEYAGAFGVVVLLCLLPALMVWSGRYCHKFETVYTAPGGKPALLLVMLFSVIVIGLEIAIKLGLI